jgi:hypothetical protein
MNRLLASFNGVAALRGAIGLAQGIALVALLAAGEQKASPGDRPELLWPLVAVVIFIPLLAVIGIGNVRWRRLVIWLVAATLLSAGVAYQAAFQGYWDARWPFWAWTWLFLPFLLLIINALVTAGDIDRKAIASYPTYFDVAWKQVTQFALATLFVGSFWILLRLGAELFRAIRIDAFVELIDERWFWIPATTAATAVSLHLTDGELGLVRAARSLLLNLLAWLMPLLVLIGLAFLLALFATGLEPMWATKVATVSLIAATMFLILLINSHFQDGEPHGGRSRLLIYSRFAGALMLVPLVALAAYGLGLRVEEYGLTPKRVLAMAMLFVLACYAVGYAIAAVASGLSLGNLRTANVLTAFVSVAVLLAILTPLADPARLSVANQVGRLLSGRVPLEQFDFRFLQRDSGRYGQEALASLKAGKGGLDTAKIDELAKSSVGESGPPPEATEATRQANITMVRPPGAAIPTEFLQADWNNFRQSWRLPSCLTMAKRGCEGFLVDLTDRGPPAIVLFDGRQASVFLKGAEDKWELAGEIANLHCKGVIEALRSGDFKTVPSAFKDIEANGSRWPVTPYCGPW